VTTLEHEREVLEQMILASSDGILEQSEKVDKLIIESMGGGES
jgi:hypothetical protein